MGIFPEGISHTAPQLARLKTGAARIAFGIKTAHPDLKLSIVPVGLTYLHRQRFRSQALVNYGEAISIDEAWMAQYREAEKEAVKSLTEEIEQRIKTLTVNTPSWEVMRLMHIARRLYRPDKVRLSLSTYTELTRRFAEGFLRASEEPAIQAMKEELEAYQARLDSLGLRDHDLRKDPGPMEIALRLFGRMLYLLILLPLAIPGLLLHLPVWVTAIVAGDGLTRRKDVVATTKLVSAILTVPLLYLAMAAGIAYLWGIWMALFAFLLMPIAGFATVRVLEQKLAIGRSLQAIARLLQYRSEVRKLRELRQILSTKIDALVDRFHDPSVPRILEKSPTSPPSDLAQP
jgi:glycerol-3-phosphate O-acyltransferase/dihydroxyacetone phosphate acyltransferase